MTKSSIISLLTLIPPKTSSSEHSNKVVSIRCTVSYRSVGWNLIKTRLVHKSETGKPMENEDMRSMNQRWQRAKSAHGVSHVSSRLYRGRVLPPHERGYTDWGCFLKAALTVLLPTLRDIGHACDSTTCGPMIANFSLVQNVNVEVDTGTQLRQCMLCQLFWV